MMALKKTATNIDCVSCIESLTFPSSFYEFGVLDVFQRVCFVRGRRVFDELWHWFKVQLNLCLIRHLASPLYHLLLLLTSQLPLVLTEVDTR